MVGRHTAEVGALRRLHGGGPEPGNEEAGTPRAPRPQARDGLEPLR